MHTIAGPFRSTNESIKAVAQSYVTGPYSIVLPTPKTGYQQALEQSIDSSTLA